MNQILVEDQEKSTQFLGDDEWLMDRMTKENKPKIETSSVKNVDIYNSQVE